ncbi:MAG TPA: cellulose binding domain-containing protein [Streptosporangiaceae bacterium]|nr:cellulose binding domain-containing protein [Streptosporangiaceae bacterium]
MCSWPTTRKRRLGRHTSLLAGGEQPGPEPAPDDGWLPLDLPVPATPAGPAGAVSGVAEASRSYWASLEGGTRVSIRGQEPSAGSDTVVLGDSGLFHRPPPGIGINRPVPARPWYRRRGPVLSLVISLVMIVATGVLAAPPLLAALGVGAQTCQQCALPIPSTAAIGPASPAMSAPASPATRPTASATPSRTASTPATPPAIVVAPQPMQTAAPPVTATYSYAGSGSGFTGQVTVINQSGAPISDWQLVVALPGDDVSAVQNAEFNDDNDILFMTPAPADLTIAPGASVAVTIYASGPTQTPAECSFNNVACQ